MRIGLLTFYNSNNYGAVLQCFALSKCLEKSNEVVEVIDYRCAHKKYFYKVCQLSRYKSIKGNISALLDIPFQLKKKIAFEKFRKRYFKMSRLTYTDSQMLRKSCPWDKVIVGSDQVWNPKNTGEDYTYLLDFIDNPEVKIAYAASFGGSELEPQVQEAYKPLLRNIGCISVREKAGVELVKRIADEVAYKVLDPTFLLKKREWKQYEEPIKTNKEYVLLYTIENSKRIAKVANEVAERLGCQVIRIATRSIDFMESGKIVIPSPGQFITLISKAKWIITDSYHGTILSINFNKSFYVVPQQTTQSNERVKDILSQFHLQQRLLEDGQSIKKLKIIDYKEINKELEQYRLQSIQFLKKSLAQRKEGEAAYEN